MTPMICIFVASVIVLAIAVFIYNRAERNASAQVAAQIKTFLAKLKEIDDRTTGNTSTVVSAKTQLDLFIKIFEKEMSSYQSEIAVFRDQLAETREKQMQLREDLSRKRPIVKFSGPIPVEIHNNPTPPKKGKGVGALIKGKT